MAFFSPTPVTIVQSVAFTLEFHQAIIQFDVRMGHPLIPGRGDLV